MKYTPLSKNILKINWTEHIVSEKDLLKFISNVDYISKSDIQYQCSTHHLTPIDFTFLSYNLNLPKLVTQINRVYNTSYSLTSIGEVVKMEEGNFLAPHTDSFHKLQCVFYITSLDLSDGGLLRIEGLDLIPKYGDVIVFHGGTLHEVSLVKTKKSRICISFGLD